MIRVARSTDDIDRWEANHPLLRRHRYADHPADALALASIDLRRALGDHDWPDDTIAPVRHDIDRAAADALAGEAPGDVGDALRWSLSELDVRTDELARVRDDRWLAERAAQGDAEARERIRQQRVAELAAAGVLASDRQWDVDGFGSADAIGLRLPCLAVALSSQRRESFAGWHFASDRTWHALEHRVAPRPMSRYERSLVSPLRIGPEVELALRRLGPRVPDGHSVRAAVAFQQLVATELPALDVGAVTERLSPAWVPFPTEAIRTLCAGTPDEHLALDALADSPGRFGPFAGWWRLAWITDDLGSGDLEPGDW